MSARASDVSHILSDHQGWSSTLLPSMLVSVARGTELASVTSQSIFEYRDSTGMLIRLVDPDQEQIVLRAVQEAQQDPYTNFASMSMTTESSAGSTASAVDAMLPPDGKVCPVQPPDRRRSSLVPSPRSVYGGWSTAAATCESTDSLSTVTSLATPSLSRTSSPGEDHRPPPTPPDASSLAFFQPTEIPVEQIHLHVGSFYYPPSSIPTSFPYKRGSLSNSSSTSLASMSSTLSRKLRFGSDKLWLKVKPVPAALLPRREIGPAISIAPPDLPPAEVFRPSIHRLTSRHMNSSLSRHPLARKNVSAASSTSKPSPSSAMLNPSTSPTRLLSHVKTRARRTLYPDLQTKPLPMKTASREGGLIMPDPLRPEEIEDGRLSIAWETRSQHRAREEKVVYAKAAKEAEAKRLFQENLHRYRAPFMGF